MPDSILSDVKQLCNIAEGDTAFDQDLRLFINAGFSTLSQLGVGPDEGFRITGDSETWEDFLEDGPLLDEVKEYLALRVKARFDPPSTGFGTNALTEIIKEAEVRISYMREDVEWAPPVPVDPIVIVDPFMDPIVLDGG